MLLNTLKILGLALSTLSAVIAALKETKTKDKKHLTDAGKLLVVLGLIGFATALGAQMKEWNDAQHAEQVNSERTARLLLEIRRAVTRFDTISMDLDYRWPLDAPELTPFAKRLTRLIQNIDDEEPYLKAGQVLHGLRVVSRTQDHISIFGASSGSEALPGKGDGNAVEYYAAMRELRIALFKKNFQPEKFDGFGAVHADLTLAPLGGKDTLHS